MTRETQPTQAPIDTVEQCVDYLIARLGNRLAVALPLGLGKPVALINALYQRAADNPSLSLKILTALSLERPVEADPVRGRLLNPVFDRLYAHYTEPTYATAVRAGNLPDNISVHEFYFKPGSRLGNARAQQDYVSSNYTHAARDVVAQGCNVVIQLLARDPADHRRLSMSCNPDTSAQVLERLRAAGRPCVNVGVVHEDLPYMVGDAEVSAADYDILLHTDHQRHGLFTLPKLAPVAAADYAIGLHASSLVADGGTLQLGIGAMGDAIVHAIQLRHTRNADYRALLQRFHTDLHWGALIDSCGGRAEFQEGLYGATEMFVEGFWQLLDSGILKREVYDFWALQALINEGLCQPQALTADTVAAMAELGVRELRGKDFAVLQYHGYFNDASRYHEGHIIAPDGQRIAANVANPDSQRAIADKCLGASLRNGKVLHGGFFLGSSDFYRSLRQMPAATRGKLAMCGVEKINQLDFNPRLYQLQRRKARFINTGLNVSLQGAVASDTLANGQVVSGVGGQYNFVSMAHHLVDGRSVLMIRATRTDGARTVSNIVPNYGSCTIPRHLRDIVITEYGIADLRSKSDREVVEALIQIADSRFQPDLIRQAQAAAKLPQDYRLPEAFSNNVPARIEAAVEWTKSQGMMPAYPFGCDFSAPELRAAAALKQVAGLSRWQRLRAVVTSPPPSPSGQSVIEVLGLDGPLNWRDQLLKRLLLAVTAETGTR
ncbi:MAG: acetyl-CoA hydrolase [Gammaproteobacteria bacterium]|nr:acetyl-CoA hydrolase [Gammaproteobacteria bacterium]